jgi:anthranilate synthase component 1
MALITRFDSFAEGWAQGKNQIVYARLAADVATPVALML